MKQAMKFGMPLYVGLALLVACAPAKKPLEPAVQPHLNTLSRETFNRTAAEHFLPLFWREDVNGDGALQPEELAVLWGYPEDDPSVWLDASGAFTPRFLAAYATLTAAPSGAPSGTQLTRRQQLVIEELAQGAPTLVRTDLSKDTPAEQAMVRHLMRAATLIERLFARQNGELDMEAKIPRDDLASRALYHRNQSVFCTAPKTEKEPECSAVEPRPPKRMGLYPVATQDTPGFCQRMDKAPNAAALRNHFSVVTDGATPGTWAAVPITVPWKDDMSAVAQELDTAAASLGSAEPALAAYLHAAAESFRTNDWDPADRAWIAMNAQNSRWYVRVAPDEVYFDPCAWKAAFALQLARINPDSIEWRQRLDPLKIQMEQQLAQMAGPPYKARDVRFTLPDFIDVVINAGDQRNASGATIGQSLPNGGPVAASGGRTVSMTNLYADPDSNARRAKLDASMLCAATDAQYRPTGRESILDSLLHEAAHNLGPSHDYSAGGKTAVMAFGGTLATTLEELKAQNSALYLTGFLTARGVFTEDESRRILRDGVTWAFGHISRGMYEVDGTPRNYSQLAAIQIGSFLDSGGLAWHRDEMAANGSDRGCLEIDYGKLPAAVEALDTTVLRIKSRADRAGAERLKARYVDAKDSYAAIKAVIAERYQRMPKASFVYSVFLPAAAASN